jgi:vacuolar-type H+-ATPase subunit D/Vma8
MTLCGQRAVVKGWTSVLRTLTKKGKNRLFSRFCPVSDDVAKISRDIESKFKKKSVPVISVR